MITLGHAQEVKESEVSLATKRYRAYRLQFTEPSFALAKVKAIIARIKSKPDQGGDGEWLATPAWNSMSPPEKFTYCMIHGEVSTQVCDVPPWLTDEEHKIFGQLTGFANEQSWSDRQRAFLKGHRSEVVRLMRTTIREKGRVGVNLKSAISDLGLYELIPDLTSIYRKDRKDQDILTVLLLLMEEGKDKPFLTSITYGKLYGKDANFASYIVANRANQDLTMQRAMAYYHRRVG